MFFEDKLKAFREVSRVLEGGGTFVFNVWDSYESNPRSFLILRVLENCFGEVPVKLKLPHSFHDRVEIERLLRAAGFGSFAIETVRKEARYKAVEDIVNAFVTGSLSSDFLQEKPEGEQRDFKEKLRLELISAFGEKDIAIPMQALVCQTVK
jgi:hypothetical protein